MVNFRDFCSVFETQPSFKVQHAGKTIGEISLTPQVQENENLLLAARSWKIKYIDEKAKKIEVVPADDSKKPIFLGGRGVVDARIRPKMLGLLSTPSWTKRARRRYANCGRNSLALRLLIRRTNAPCWSRRGS